MKILITTDWYKPVINGVVTSVINLVKGLEEKGHEVRILTLADGNRSYVSQNVTYIGSLDAGKIYPNARLGVLPGRRFIKNLIRWKPDIVHSQCEFSTFIYARIISEKTSAPLIHTYHTVYEDFTHYFSPNVKFGKIMAARFSKLMLDRTDSVIAPTEKTRKLLLGYGVKSPIYTVPSGLDISSLSKTPDKEKLNKMRDALGIPKNARVMLFLGRLAKEKNIEEIFSLLKNEKSENLYLLLVGDGPYRSELEALAHRLEIDNRTIFAGMVQPSEAADYYKLGDVFASASHSETQGLTYMEAMASGLPCLCHDDPCLWGVISDGENGLIYRSEQEFHDKLKRLLNESEYRKYLGQNAAKSAREQYSAERFVSRILEIYEKASGEAQIKSDRRIA